MIHRKKIVGLALALVLLVIPLAALADGTVIILPGFLSALIPDFAYVDQSFNPFADTTVDQGFLEGSVSDTDESAAGWNITVVASDWETSPGAADGWLVTTASANFLISMPDGAANLDRIAGVGGPPDSVSDGGFTALDNTTPLEIAECHPTVAHSLGLCGPGDGLFTMRPRFRLVIPAGTSPGTYSSVITVDALLGP